MQDQFEETIHTNASSNTSPSDILSLSISGNISTSAAASASTSTMTITRTNQNAGTLTSTDEQEILPLTLRARPTVTWWVNEWRREMHYIFASTAKSCTFTSQSISYGNWYLNILWHLPSIGTQMSKITKDLVANHPRDVAYFTSREHLESLPPTPVIMIAIVRGHRVVRGVGFRRTVRG